MMFSGFSHFKVELSAEEFIKIIKKFTKKEFFIWKKVSLQSIKDKKNRKFGINAKNRT